MKGIGWSPMIDEDKWPHERHMEPPTQFYRDKIQKEKIVSVINGAMDAVLFKIAGKDEGGKEIRLKTTTRD